MVKKTTPRAKKRLKILLASDFFPPRLGGMEKHVEALAKKLSEKHSVVVATHSIRGEKESEKKQGYTVRRLESFFLKLPFLFRDPDRKLLPPWPDPFLKKGLEKIIRKEKPDVVHAHGWILYSLLPLKKKLGFPLLATMHDYGYVCPSRALVYQNSLCRKQFSKNCLKCRKGKYNPLKSLIVWLMVKLQKKNLSKVDHWIAVSSFVKKAYSSHIPFGKISVIPNFYEPKKTKKTQKTKPHILYLGVLAQNKGVDLLVNAYEKLAGKKPQLWLVGRSTKNYEPKKTGGVKVFKDASDTFVQQAYENAVFTVVPSLWPDPCPTVVFEAMSHGKAVLGAKIGGIVDLVDKNGMLFQPGSEIELSKKLGKMLESDLSKMGKNGEKRLREEFSAEKVVPKIVSLYEKLVQLHD